MFHAFQDILSTTFRAALSVALVLSNSYCGGEVAVDDPDPDPMVLMLNFNCMGDSCSDYNEDPNQAPGSNPPPSLSDPLSPTEVCISIASAIMAQVDRGDFDGQAFSDAGLVDGELASVVSPILRCLGDSLPEFFDELCHSSELLAFAADHPQASAVDVLDWAASFALTNGYVRNRCIQASAAGGEMS